MRIFKFGADYVHERKLRKESYDTVTETGTQDNKVETGGEGQENNQEGCSACQEAQGEETECKKVSSKSKKFKGKD